MNTFKRLKNKKSKNSIPIIIRNRLLMILAIMIIVMLFIQIYILSSVGTIGPEISRIRQEKDKLQLDNKILQANIREKQTNEEIISTLEQNFEMEKTNLKRLEIFEKENTIAQN